VQNKLYQEKQKKLQKEELLIEEAEAAFDNDLYTADWNVEEAFTDLINEFKKMEEELSFGSETFDRRMHLFRTTKRPTRCYFHTRKDQKIWGGNSKKNFGRKI
jgi:hypothetical protein